MLFHRTQSLLLSAFSRCSATVLFAGALMLWPSTTEAQSSTPRAFGGSIGAIEMAGGKLFVAGSFLGVSASEDITGDIAIVDAVTGRRATTVARRINGATHISSDGAGGYFVAGTSVAHLGSDGSSSYPGYPYPNGGFPTVTLRVGSTLYVGGTWRNIVVAPSPAPLVDQPFLAAYDANTLQLLPWWPVVNGDVRALYAANGVLYVGGAFTTVSNGPGQPVLGRSRVAAFDLSNGTLTAWNPAANGSFVTKIEGAGNTLFLAGEFLQMGGQPRQFVAAVDAASGSVLPWNPSPNRLVFDLVATGSTVVLGGFFSHVGPQPRFGVAAVDFATGAVLPWSPQPNDAVTALAVSGSVVYTCGQFTRIAGQQRAGCAAFDFTAGATLQTWNPSLNGPVVDVVVADGRVAMTGPFTGINAIVRRGLAALDPATGTLLDWEANPDVGLVGEMVSDGTRLFVASNAFGYTLNAVDIATGGRPPGWTPQAVWATGMAMANGQLLLGTATTGRVEVHDAATGALLSVFATLDGFVDEIVVAGDTVYLGGGFSTVNGTPRQNLAALSLASRALLPLSVPINSRVRALAIAGPTLFLGGHFTSVGGTPRTYLAAVDAITGAVLPWAPSPSGTVLELFARQDRLYVGGFFSQLNGRNQHGLAVFDTAGVQQPYSVNLEGDLVNAVYANDEFIVVGGSFYYGTTDVVSNLAILPNRNGAPRNLAATVAGNHVRFTWDPPNAADPATTYVLEAGASSGTTFFTAPLGSALSFSVDAPNGTFFVRVRASVAGTLGAPSNEVVITTPYCGAVAAPASLIGSAASGVVTLGWQAVAGALGYLLEAGTAPGISNIAVIPIGLATAFQTQAPPGTYYVRVRATNGCTTSASSNEVAVTVAGPAPPGVPILNTPQVTEQSVHLTWSPGSGGTPASYLQVATATSGGPAIASVPLAGTSAAFSNIPFGIYYLRLLASNAVGSSAFSNEVVAQVSPRVRAVADQPDDVSGPQVKVLYVVPSDGTDRVLDVNGTLDRSVAAFQSWLRRESGGLQFKMDTRNGQLDIAMVRLVLTDAQVMSGGVRQRDLLEARLTGLGFNVAGKMYAVYYEGGHQSTCGDAFLPPGLPGSVVAVYLHGTPPGARPCDTNLFAASDASPGYLEFLMAHELFHGMGLVATCAPNHSGGHVGDDPSDLMYAGSQPWTPLRLDTNRDDYFAHGRACADASQSPYLTR